MIEVGAITGAHCHAPIGALASFEATHQYIVNSSLQFAMWSSALCYRVCNRNATPFWFQLAAKYLRTKSNTGCWFSDACERECSDYAGCQDATGCSRAGWYRLVQRLERRMLDVGEALEDWGCGASGRLFILFFWGTGSVFKIHCGNFSHH